MTNLSDPEAMSVSQANRDTSQDCEVSPNHNPLVGKVVEDAEPLTTIAFPTPEELVKEALPPSLNIEAPFPPIPILSKEGEPLEAATRLKTETQVQLQQLQTQLELATGWIKVKEIEKMTAQLKLEKIRKDAAVRGEELTPAQMEEITKGRLGAKAKEVAVARLKEYKLKSELRVVTLKEQLKKADLELENLKIVKRTQDMSSEIAEIKQYILVIKGENDSNAKKGGLHNPERDTFFYCDCKVGGLGKWFCEILSERPKWQRYPAQKWFLSQMGCQIYSPVGKVSVDYTDQPDFAIHTSSLTGSDWLEDKGKLASLTRHLQPPTYEIVNRQWAGEAGEPQEQTPPGAPAFVWFLKETDKNYATGIHLAGSIAACIEMSKPDTHYVVQPHIANPLLYYKEDGKVPHKFNMRIYVAAVSPRNDPNVYWYIFKGGYVGTATKPWCPISTEKEVQISRDRAAPFIEWEGFERGWPIMHDTVKDMLECCHDKITPPVAKAAFELYGTDIMLDDEWKPYLLEVNRSPRVLDMDRPMVRGLLARIIPQDAPEPDEFYHRWIKVDLDIPSSGAYPDSPNVLPVSEDENTQPTDIIDHNELLSSVETSEIEVEPDDLSLPTDESTL